VGIDFGWIDRRGQRPCNDPLIAARWLPCGLAGSMDLPTSRVARSFCAVSPARNRFCLSSQGRRDGGWQSLDLAPSIGETR